MKSKIIRLFAVSALSVSLTCCNYLNMSDELTGGVTNVDQIFSNVDYTKKWYGEVFANVPDYSRMWSTASMGNIWSFYTDELFSRIANNSGKYQEWNSRNGNSQRWHLYESIRQANVFLERARPIMEEGGTNAARLTEAEVVRYKAEVRFMRAAYYFYLMEIYGPVPILTQSLSYPDDELDLPRNSLDEVIQFIDSELEEAMANMEQEPYHDNESFRAVPTKGTAMALRAKLWVYASSKLFNGGYTEALQITNKDGKRLFPEYSEEKLNNAVKYCKEFIDYAEQGARYELYKNTGTFDATKSIYELFQSYNKEIIWATAQTAWGKLGDQNFESMITPRSEPKGLGGIHVLQELVDEFYMKDGYPIKQTSFLPKSDSYTETGFSTLDNYEVSNMYINREPRFYNTITFSGKKWHISGKETQFYLGGNADKSVPDGAPVTGYLLYKRANQTIHGNTPGVASKFRPSIIFRLADFYLLYAEVLNEKSPGDADVLKYVNLVRERAGLDKLEALNPAIQGDKEMQREAIRRERRIELATEGQRYFDVCRWMIAENAPGEGGQGGVFTGMSPDYTKAAFHTRRNVQTRVFKRKNYLYPIPLVEMQRSQVLVQNPGW